MKIDHRILGIILFFILGLVMLLTDKTNINSIVIDDLNQVSAGELASWIDSNSNDFMIITDKNNSSDLDLPNCISIEKNDKSFNKSVLKEKKIVILGNNKAWIKWLATVFKKEKISFAVLSGGVTAWNMKGSSESSKYKSSEIEENEEEDEGC